MTADSEYVASGSSNDGASPRRPLAALEATLGYEFQNKDNLATALVHKSYLHDVPRFRLEPNERMEFLGDAVLGLIVSANLYLLNPGMAEGQLSSLRGALVRLSTLAEIAAPIELGEYMFMSRGEEAAGGRTRESNTGRALEAVLGAVYIDGGLQAAENVWKKIGGERGIEQLEEVLKTDYKSQLQQFVQAHYRVTPSYSIVETSGPEHDKTFMVEVVAGEHKLATGRGRNKQLAEQAAAKQALDTIRIVA